MISNSAVKTNSTSNIIPMNSATVHQLSKAGFTRSQIVKMKHLSPHVPVQPIKSLEDIKKIKEYFLSQPSTYRNNNLNIRNEAIFVLNINIGLRASDLLHLHIYDVLNSNLTFKNECMIIESKTGKTKVFNLCNNAKEAITMYLKTRPNFKLTDYLFTSKKCPNKPLTVNGLNRVLTKMAKEVNIGEHHNSSHVLRKTFAYQKYVAHKDDPYVLSTIQSVLNHSSEKTTLKYLGIDNEVKRDLYLNDEL